MVISVFLILAGMVCGGQEPGGFLNKQTVQLDPGKKVTYTVPAMDTKGNRVTLSFLARGKSTNYGGYNHGLQVRVNGRVVQAAEDRRMVRLLNKPLRFPYKQWKGMTYLWDRYYARGTGWVIIYAPDYKPSDERPWLGDQWANYVLAVDDLLCADKPNVIQFSNEHSRKTAVVLVDKVQLTRTDQAGFGDLKQTPAFPDCPLKRTDFASLKNPNLQVGADGGLVIQHDGRKYNFETIFSYPQGGYNILGAGPSPEEPEKKFTVKVTPLDVQAWRVTAEGEFYTIDRLIKIEWGKVYVADTIRNKTDSTLGVIVKHYLKFGQAVPNVLIGGNDDPALNDVHTSANPTLFVPLANGGLGLVANDGLSRLQSRFYYDPDKWSVGVKNENLALGPGKSHTMTRSIYVLEGQGQGNYFDFINYVRRDWGSNFRVDGPYDYIRPEVVLEIDDAKLIEYVKANRIYAVSLTSSWKDPQTGKWHSWFVDSRWPQPSAKYYRQLVTDSIAKLRRTVPHVKILHKYHTYLNVVDDDIDKYADSWMIDHNGQMLTYGQYRECFYPTLTNRFGKAMFDMITKVMEEHKPDGLYWDEFNGPGAADNMLIPYSTFDKWDGHTAVIDPKTKQIITTAGLVRLLSADWVAEALRRLESYDGLLLANAQPCLPEYNIIKFPRRVETNDRVTRMLEANLYSPLGKPSGHTPSISVIRQHLELGGITIRGPIANKWPVVGFFFPLTPIELHRGWILAEERLITARSGRFGWDTKVSGTLYKFNAAGQQVDQKQVTVPARTAGTASTPSTPSTGGGLDIVVPEDGIAILVRS